MNKKANIRVLTISSCLLLVFVVVATLFTSTSSATKATKNGWELSTKDNNKDICAMSTNEQCPGLCIPENCKPASCGCGCSN